MAGRGDQHAHHVVSAGAGLYPSDSAIASRSAEATSCPYLAGTGLDLRDDPTPLYAKTAGTALDAFPGYMFKVAPYNAGGEVPLSECPTVTAQLPKRTRYLNEPPADTSADLGAMAGHSAASVLDSGTADPARLELETTDLSIVSWGPVAELTRTYRSDATSTTMFAPGWRFAFEQRVDADGSDAVWTDAQGGTTRFVHIAGGGYRAPRSVVATLTNDGSSEPWSLELKGGTILRFDAQGRLASEADRDGRQVDYDWSVAGALTITAANTQAMTLTLEGGRVTSASYLDREVHYAFEPGGSVATVTIDPHASTNKTLVYSYSAGYLTGLRVAEVSSAEWGFGYSGSAVSTVAYPGFADDEHRVGVITYGTDSASLTRYGEVDGVADTAIATTYRWSPTGAMLERSNPGTTTAVWSYEYNAVGEQLLGKSPMGRTTWSMTDLRGNVVRSTDEGGRVTTTVYDSADDAIQEIDPRGSATTRTYASGRLTAEEKVLDATGRHSRTEYTYQASSPWLLTSRRSQIDTDTWAQSDYSDFASNGEPRSTIEREVKLSVNGAPQNLETSRVYDEAGRLVSETDALHVPVTSQTFDAAGRVTESQDASGVVTHARYDALGNVTETWRSHESSPAAKLDWKITTYDGESRVLRETLKDSAGDPLATITHAYDPLGRETSSDNSVVGGVNVIRYDAAGNATKTWAEGSNLSTATASTRTSVNADSQTTSELQPAATTSATVPVYNADASVAEQKEPDGSSVEFEYEADGDLDSEASPSDEGTATTEYETDLDGQTVAQTEPDQAQVTYTYDLLGRLVSSGILGQQMSTKLYNTLGWVLSETDFDGVTKTKEYDDAGRVTAETIGGQRTIHAYDALGRETSRTNPDGSSITFTRDVFGRATREVHTGTNSATARDTATGYDVAGRVTSTSDAVSGLARTYAYDPSGAATITETRPGGRTITFGMHSTGLLTSISGMIAGRSVDWSVTATDAAGRVTNARSSTFANDWRLAYDQAGRVVSGGGGSRTYAYSPSTGKKTRDSFALRFGSEETTYTYDVSGRLEGATRNGGATTYAYEAASGAMSAYRRPSEPTTTLTYDASGHLSTAGTKRYSYDSLGRRDWAGSSTNPSETAYVWSGERLTGVTSPGRSSIYVYDATGQRTRSVATSGSVTTTTTWTYDGLRLLGLAAQVSDATTYTLDYLYDERGVVFAGVYAATETTAVPFLMVTTDRGDVRELLDENGAGFAHYSYDAYGVPIGSATAPDGTASVPTSTVTAIASRQPLRYASYTFDESSGLYYCSRRYYDAGVAAFISKDPARADGEESAYQYCGGDPVGKVDPSGCVAYTVRTGQTSRLVNCHITGYRIVAVGIRARMMAFYNAAMEVLAGVLSAYPGSGYLAPEIRMGRDGPQVLPQRIPLWAEVAVAYEHRVEMRTTYYTFNHDPHVDLVPNNRGTYSRRARWALARGSEVIPVNVAARYSRVRNRLRLDWRYLQSLFYSEARKVHRIHDRRL
jgi:RHS repeat-associated protein